MNGNVENVEEVKEVKLIKCASCSKEIKEDDAHEVFGGDRVCDKCFEDYSECGDCGDIMHGDDMYRVYNCGSERYVCEVCADSNYSECSQCGEQCNDTHEDGNGDWYCASCRDSGYGDFSDEDEECQVRDRGFKKLPNDILTIAHQSKESGEIIKSERKFACELECYYPTSEKAEEVYQAITNNNKKLEGVGITSDGSLSSRGIEYQTPILQGSRGEEFIKNFGELLIRSGYKTDTTCGLHVHLDGNDFFEVKDVDISIDWSDVEKDLRQANKWTDDLQDKLYSYNYSPFSRYPKEFFDFLVNCGNVIENKSDINKSVWTIVNKKEKEKRIAKVISQRIKRLFTLYYYLEPVIYQFLPESRRNNRYCYPIDEDYALSIIQKSEDVESIEKHWYSESTKKDVESRKKNRYDSTRYHGLNFHSLLGEKHFEVRHHSGTINPTKILYWIKLHQKIVDLAHDKENYINEDFLRGIKRELSLTKKRQKLYKFLQLDNDMVQYFESRARLFTVDDTKDNEESVTPESIKVALEKKPDKPEIIEYSGQYEQATATQMNYYRDMLARGELAYTTPNYFVTVNTGTTGTTGTIATPTGTAITINNENNQLTN